MTGMSKWLVAGGLVIVTSPFCYVAQAQDYVDVEAERQGRESAPQTAPTVTPAAADPYASPASSDPYSVQPAQSYPATSYGMSSAPAGAAVAAPTAQPAAASAGQGNVGNLFLQVQQLQQEVMRLNGMVEEQANELRILKAQSLERYVDLDKRLNAGGASGGSSTGTGGSQVVPAPGAGGSIGSSSSTEIPGEADAYKSAYAQVRSQQFDSAVTAFNDFLRKYPDGKYAPNAHYWLGELYLVVQPRDLEGSRQAFTLLLDQYPSNGKAPDAMYKLGKVYFEKGNRERAREYMDQVISQYGNTSSSAVKLARDFISQNY
ncbi:tol-pal system protein YbgF [Halioglobus maricola]|uniref:Cell division coordinator CpoB n=2 Tax=Halioglobus maricola TaxID=2601894 RepID=A0A5P9NGT9_9GAMM|nr:tol-pal system protein YbgF [Halioglobus maricola]